MEQHGRTRLPTTAAFAAARAVVVVVVSTAVSTGRRPEAIVARRRWDIVALGAGLRVGRRFASAIMHCVCMHYVCRGATRSMCVFAAARPLVPAVNTSLCFHVTRAFLPDLIFLWRLRPYR